MRCFIAGTDTGVGKTFVTSRILRQLKQNGKHTIGFKPIACGDREDAIELLEAGTPGQTLDQINPVWLALPASPLVAAKRENRVIDNDLIRTAYHELCKSHEQVMVEGVGGWLVPISSTYSMADLACELNLPVVVVAANRLGVLNHTLLTIESIRARNLPILAVILNQVTAERDASADSNLSVLDELLHPLPVIELSFGAKEIPDRLAQLFQEMT